MLNKERPVMWETPEEFLTSYYFGHWPKKEIKPIRPKEEWQIVKRKMLKIRRDGK